MGVTVSAFDALSESDRAYILADYRAQNKMTAYEQYLSEKK
jgi:hypothetical protein